MKRFLIAALLLLSAAAVSAQIVAVPVQNYGAIMRGQGQVQAPSCCSNSTPAPSAAIANWNGQSRYVTTVTGLPGLACGYNYAGQQFVRVFTGGFCPAAIPVQ